MPQHELLACAQCGCFAFSCFEDFAIRANSCSMMEDLTGVPFDSQRMPKRPRAHRLEYESRQHFRELLPEGWVFRDETPDYGIDGEVEIFDNTGNPTGFRFHVQLKATDRPDSSFASQVRLRRETVDYYLSLSRPILLVSYHSGSQRLYWRWFHFLDPYYGGFGKKWVRVSFAKADLWGLQTPATIETDLRLRRLAETGPLVLVRSKYSCAVGSRAGAVLRTRCFRN